MEVTVAGETQQEGQPPTLRQRRLLISANVLVQIVAVLALVVMLNWLASRYYARFDWTRTGYYKLSEKTTQTLAALKEPLKIIVFLQPGGEREYLEKTYQDVRNLLKEFQFVGRDKVQVEYVDPQRDRARAEQLVVEYKVDLPNVVIFASGGRHKYVSLDDIVEFDMQGFGREYRVEAFKGEGAFLSAIQTVTEEQPAKVYFLTGHGERDPEDFDQRDGYSELARYIKRDNITVHKWNLLENQSLPADASAIVIAGPRKPFTEPELNALGTYLKNKGRLLVMIDARQQTGLESLLKDWGVQVDDNLAMAKGGMLLGSELLIVDALGVEYAPHPITAKLQGINTSFPYARTIRRATAEGSAAAGQTRVTELVKTPAAFWAETDLDTHRSSFDPDRDLKGPLSLAVAVETSKPHGVDLDLGLTRMVVVGTSGFVDNSSLTGGNLDFFMNSLNWLLEREPLVAVSPKLPEEFRLDMSVGQARAVYALVIAGMPLAVAAIGLMVWARRRK